MHPAGTTEGEACRQALRLNGDFSLVLFPLPKIALYYIFYLPDDEFSASATCLFSANAVSFLPVDGLAGFVERSLGQDIVLTRQMLTIHGLPAERVLLYSDTAGGKITTFYVSADNMVYVISGSGDEAEVEAVARSFNTPQVIALQ